MSTEALAALGTLAVLCLIQSLRLIAAWRAANYRAAADRATINDLRMHRDNYARSIIDGYWKPVYSERTRYALTSLVFPAEGALDERRACMEYRSGRGGYYMQLLKDIKRKPAGADRARLVMYHAAHVLALHALTAKWQADCVVAVPSASHNLARRGFNQAALLAQSTAYILHLPYTDALTRTRQTASQVDVQTRQARRDNVRGAFRASSAVRGKTVILVDDVTTTGSTLLECAAALKEAGAARVYGLTLASMGYPKPARRTSA